VESYKRCCITDYYQTRKARFDYSKKEAGDAKNAHLHVTDKGKLLSKAHKDYNNKVLTWADKTLRKSFKNEEINLFYRVMQKYTQLLDMPDIE
jgi:hypothetical protein